MISGNTFSTLDRMLSLNRVLDEAFLSPWTGDNAGQVWVPSLDIVERQDAYELTIEIPGVDPADVDISFEQNVLTVKGQKQYEDSTEDSRVYASERVTGKFMRSVRLPAVVDADHITAESKHGVLYVTVPKAQSAKARKISVSGHQQKQINGGDGEGRQARDNQRDNQGNRQIKVEQSER